MSYNHCRTWSSLRSLPQLHRRDDVDHREFVDQMTLRKIIADVANSANSNNAAAANATSNSKESVTPDDVSIIEVATSLPVLQGIVPNPDRRIFAVDDDDKNSDEDQPDTYVSDPDMLINAGTESEFKVRDMTVFNFGALSGTSPAYPSALLSDDPDSQNVDAVPSGNTIIPIKFDVRNNRSIRGWKVLDQGTCGSCFAVSAVDCLAFQIALAESREKREVVTVPNLSLRQLLGCSYDTANLTNTSRPKLERGMPTGSYIRSVKVVPTNGRSPSTKLSANAIEQGKEKQSELFKAMDDVWGDYVENVATMVQTEDPPYNNLAYNAGCWGGTPDRVWAFLVANGGLTPVEGDKPYLHYDKELVNLHKGSTPYYHQYPLPLSMTQDWQKNTCKRGPYTLGPYAVNCKGSNMTNCFQILGADNIKRFVMENGPVQIVILQYNSLQTYKSGVYTSKKGEITTSNHAVVLCGWGVTDKGMAYWTLKNSYGTRWGENGYFRVWVRDPCLNANNRVVATVKSNQLFCKNGVYNADNCRERTKPGDMVAWTARVISLRPPTRSLFRDLAITQNESIPSSPARPRNVSSVSGQNLLDHRQHVSSSVLTQRSRMSNNNSNTNSSNNIIVIDEINGRNAGAGNAQQMNGNIQMVMNSGNNGTASMNASVATNSGRNGMGNAYSGNTSVLNSGNGNGQTSNSRNTSTGNNANSSDLVMVVNNGANNAGSRNSNAINVNAANNRGNGFTVTNMGSSNNGGNGSNMANMGGLNSNGNGANNSGNGANVTNMGGANNFGNNGGNNMQSNGDGPHHRNSKNTHNSGIHHQVNGMYANSGYATIHDSGMNSPVFIQSLPSVPQYQVMQPFPMTPNNPTLAYVKSPQENCDHVSNAQKVRGICVPCLPASSLVDMTVANLIASYSPFPCEPKGAGTWIGGATQYVNNFGPAMNDVL